MGCFFAFCRMCKEFAEKYIVHERAETYKKQEEQNMLLTVSKALMRTKYENSEFDSYALYVRVGDKEETAFFKNVP